MTRNNAHLIRKLAPVFLASGALLSGCGGGGGSSDGPDRGDGSGDADISGEIAIASGARVDSDYADLWSAPGDANPASPDPVPMPVPGTAGGFMSHRAGDYGDGFTVPADMSDSYTASLQNGDRYLLQCFPSAGGDASGLDVSLALNGTNLADGDACGTGGTISSEQALSTLVISTGGGGPFRYVLTVVPQWALTAMDVRWPEPDLQVNEAIVTGTPAVARTLSSTGVRASSVMDQVRPIGPDTYHVQRASGTRAFSAPAPGASATGNDDSRAETIDWIRSLREDFGLQAEPNYVVRPSTLTPDSNPLYQTLQQGGLPDNWNLDQINMESGWQSAGKGWGEDIGIAVMDTGLFRDKSGDWHEDLRGNVVGLSDDRLLDFVSEAYDEDDTPGHDRNPATPFDTDPSTASFHGTHVAGILAALDNDEGTVGIAHRATVLPYRVLGTHQSTGEQGIGSSADLIYAINAAAGRSGVHVINLSLGGLPQLTSLQTATDRAYSNDVLVVAAGGNNGDASAIYPAANRRVLGVGATSRDGQLSSYSNFGQSVDLLAPGGERGDISDGIINAYGPTFADDLEDYYAYLAGTSMAAPHVSGVYALMKSTRPGLTPDQFRAQLIAGELTSDALDNYPLYGAGLLDAGKALGTSPDSFPTVVSAWPRVLSLDPSGGPATVLLEVLKREGEAAPRIAESPVVPDEFLVTDGAGNPIQASGPIPGSLKISVDPESMTPNRPVVDNVVIPYTDGSVRRDLVIPVYVQAADPVRDRNAGRHYALLLDANDPGSGRTLQTLASYSNGRYRYSFEDVPPGDYYLVAGSDLDNNGMLCENGEACAEYPRNGARRVISVGDGEPRQLDMTTSFRRPRLAEMGLPRYGFRGYAIPEHQNGSQPDRALSQ